MSWPRHYLQRYMSYMTSLAELNTVAVRVQFKQYFRSTPDDLSLRNQRSLIAMKLAADQVRKDGEKQVPADALAMLSLMKERDRV